VKKPELVPLFTLDLEVVTTEVTATTTGTRATSPIKAGKFVGERLSGTLLPIGGDWAIIDGEGTFRLDARIVLQIEGGPMVHVSYNGRLAMPADGMQRLLSGEPLDPDEVYFRVAPVFEVEPGPYGWLNKVQAVGVGALSPGSVTYDFYEVA
jgi:hypothetical protein